MNRSAAEIVREYGPFAGVDGVNGVTYDGEQVWFASGDKLNAFDPASGKMLRSIDVAAHAGTAFDGRHLFQIAEDRIQKIDPESGRVLATIPAPGGGGDSGLAWAEGSLWVGQYRDRKIHQIDPETGAILRTIESNRFVTGVTWVDGELWYGTWEGDESDLTASRSSNGRGPGEARDAAWRRRVGARVRWRRSVLLRRRKQRKGESCPPAQARLRGGQRLRDQRRPHEQVIEAAEYPKALGPPSGVFAPGNFGRLCQSAKQVTAASQRVAQQSALKLFTDRDHEREVLRNFFERLGHPPGARRTAPKADPEYMGSRWDRQNQPVGESRGRTRPGAGRAKVDCSRSGS